MTDRMRERGKFIVSETEGTRFWMKVKMGGGCWPWLGAKKAAGYGQFRRTRGGNIAAYRYAYELLRGPIPPGLALDHLCRNPNCVNPAHLEPVTRTVNTMRGDTIPARNAAKTHCKRGHPFTPENTYRKATGVRQCRACGNAAQKAYQQRKAQA